MFRMMSADALRIGDTIILQNREIPVISLDWFPNQLRILVNGNWNFEDCDVVKVKA